MYAAWHRALDIGNVLSDATVPSRGSTGAGRDEFVVVGHASVRFRFGVLDVGCGQR